MWSNIGKFPLNLLKPLKWTTELKRSAFILERIRPLKLNKLGAKVPKKLKRSAFYYKLIEDTDVSKKPPLELVLTKDVPGIGMAGEKIKANYYLGYRDLLLPKLAIYADSPEAIDIIRRDEDVQHSSIYSKIVENYLMGQVLPILISGEIQWTLQPWHVKFSLRKKGILVNNDCIIMPKEKISGPNSDVENKDFIVKLVMNKTETFSIRCRIYHWSNIDMAFKDSDALYLKSEPLFPEEEEIIDNLRKAAEKIRKSKLLGQSKSQK